MIGEFQCDKNFIKKEETIECTTSREFVKFIGDKSEKICMNSYSNISNILSRSQLPESHMNYNFRDNQRNIVMSINSIDPIVLTIKMKKTQLQVVSYDYEMQSLSCEVKGCVNCNKATKLCCQMKELEMDVMIIVSCPSFVKSLYFPMLEVKKPVKLMSAGTTISSVKEGVRSENCIVFYGAKTMNFTIKLDIIDTQSKENSNSFQDNDDSINVENFYQNESTLHKVGRKIMTGTMTICTHILDSITSFFFLTKITIYFLVGALLIWLITKSIQLFRTGRQPTINPPAEIEIPLRRSRRRSIHRTLSRGT